jgi:DNA sulfur modification protein DndC
MVAVDNNKLYTRSRNTDKEIEKILNQGWLHYETIREELKNEIDEN